MRRARGAVGRWSGVALVLGLTAACRATDPVDVDTDDPAVDDTDGLGFLGDGTPQPVAPEDVDPSGLLLDRLDVFLSAEAGASSVGDALAGVEGELVSSRPGLPWVTVRVPRFDTRADAEAVAAALAEHPAILHASPAWLARPPLPLGVAPAQFAPERVAGDNAYLGEQRFFSAWNASGLPMTKVPVWVMDAFLEHTLDKVAKDQLPNDMRFVGTAPRFATRESDGGFAGNHGFWVAGIIGATVDTVTPTGAHPDPARGLELVGLNVADLGSMFDFLLHADRELPTGAFFILNASLGYEGEEDGLSRALTALLWRTVVVRRPVPFLTVAASGNDGVRDPDVALLASPFITEAGVDDLAEVVEGADALVVDAAVVIAEQFEGEAVRRRAGRTLVVGATEADGSPASFSNDGAQQVRMTGVDVRGACVRQGGPCRETPTGLVMTADGTSAAAPIAAGLAAWLRSIDPTLSAEALHGLLRTHDDGRWVDALSATLSLESRGVPVRRAWLDYFGEGTFEDGDVTALLAEITAGDEADATAPRTWPRADLNGDGRARSDTFGAVDLDGDGRLGIVRFPVPAASGDGTVDRTVDESFASDLDILCWGAYAGPFTGTESVRDAELGPRCTPGALQPGMRVTGTLSRRKQTCVSVPSSVCASGATSGTEISAENELTTITVDATLRGDRSLAGSVSGTFMRSEVQCKSFQTFSLGSVVNEDGTVNRLAAGSGWTPTTVTLEVTVSGTGETTELRNCGLASQTVTGTSSTTFSGRGVSFGEGALSNGGATLTFTPPASVPGASVTGTLTVVP